MILQGLTLLLLLISALQAYDPARDAEMDGNDWQHDLNIEAGYHLDMDSPLLREDAVPRSGYRITFSRSEGRGWMGIRSEPRLAQAPCPIEAYLDRGLTPVLSNKGRQEQSQWVHRRGPQTSAFVKVITGEAHCLGLVLHYPTEAAADWAYSLEAANAGFRSWPIKKGEP